MFKNPTLKEEKKLWKKGYKLVAGMDEAGRGPLAGPVVAAAVVMINPKSKILLIAKQLQGAKRLVCISKSRWNRESSTKSGQIPNSKIQFLKIRDSKKLSSKKREEFYKILTKHPQIKWGRSEVSEKVIDKINILEATKLAMMKAVVNLNSKLPCLPAGRKAPCLVGRQENSKLKLKSQNFHNKIQYLIIDGNFKINSKIPQKSIVKGDEKVFSCAAASIIAKVTRDRLMLKTHKKYPKYRFDRHKGYPTRAHRAMLKKYGPCEIHRMSFNPVVKSQKSKVKSPKL